MQSKTDLLTYYLICSLCSYEPELFPGLIYRMVKPRIVLLIFVSGKVVLTGMLHWDGLFVGLKVHGPIFLFKGCIITQETYFKFQLNLLSHLDAWRDQGRDCVFSIAIC